MEHLSPIRLALLAVFASGFFNGCNESHNVNTKTSPVLRLDKTAIAQAAEKKIYFGHQSVGNDVLEGVALLTRDSDPVAGVKIMEVERAEQVQGPGIYHSRIGKNRDTRAKLVAFEEILIKNGVGDRIDMALMKFCYVDITADTDVKALFKAYEATMQKIEQHFPDLVLIHCTVPLTVHGGGLRKSLRNWIKGDMSNVQRARYNQMLRERFAKSGHIFDIAAAESTLPNGARVTFKHKKERFEAAAPQYTDGVGHLNANGGKHVASQFLAAVAGVRRSATL